ncbi:MAG: hypothetical protein AMJ75_09330 [Phycisphaerae bacterium SM1_79]|nr:MAG: hypothetical protein AMJ75_09330 [Phycisphaerae bacterium SM1_79]
MTDKGIQQGLEQDARRISERIPDKMTKKAILDVRLRLQEFVTRQGWSRKRIGEMIGRSPSTISLFLKGEYKGDAEDLSKKLHQLMESCERRQRRPHGETFVSTTVAKKIFTVITETEAFSNSPSDPEGKIGIIIGDGGHGKSHCLRQYAEANKNTVYVELDDAMTSTLIFAEIAKRLNIESSGSRATITRRLIEALYNRQIIIMLDEASLLSVRELNLLRQVIVIKARCPLILAGNRYLVNTVMQPTTKRGCESLDQFTSRLMCILDLDEMAIDKDGGLYTAEDIRKLYEYGGLKLTSDAIATLRKIARSARSGRLRTCGHIIAACHQATSVQKIGQINTQIIISAIVQLKLPVRVFLPLAIKETYAEDEQAQAVKAG